MATVQAKLSTPKLTKQQFQNLLFQLKLITTKAMEVDKVYSW